MMMYLNKTTELIIGKIEEIQDDNDFEVINVSEKENVELIAVAFRTSNCPSGLMLFTSEDDPRRIGAKLLGIVENIPEFKKARMIETCNILNKISFFNLYVEDDSVMANYTIPLHTSDECVGEIVEELIHRAEIFMVELYPVFVMALYTQTDIQKLYEQRVLDIECAIRMFQSETIDDDNKCGNAEDDTNYAGMFS